jgi:hypothetical protein
LVSANYPTLLYILGVENVNPVTVNTLKGNALTELQGLTMSLLAGANANTKINLAAIRPEDTLVGALNNNAGTITDILSTITIEDCKASGTLTGTSVIATDAVNVNGKTYTFQAADPTALGQVKVGGTDTASMANLAAAINAYETDYARTNGLGVKPAVVATAASNVVTVKAVEEGTGGNAIVLTSADGTIVASGSGTLAGGTATGGIKSSGATNQIILFWFNKK